MCGSRVVLVVVVVGRDAAVPRYGAECVSLQKRYAGVQPDWPSRARLSGVSSRARSRNFRAVLRWQKTIYLCDV